ncbi:MAG: helix-turn-helix transcriptional regulator [Clostridia bacterium]|nr:helix-turn-helix transcriptional regulator [Clostridia bacterium]
MHSRTMHEEKTMKLSIGENIRKFRKNNDLTQETLAEQLGVTYQSISRWENGTTYPDIELLPAIAETLKITVDELLGMTQMEKEKRACNAFDKLRCECMKRDYNADRIIELLRDIRRNYLDSDLAWSPWVEGNDRAFRNPKILPEVRLLAEAYFARHPMDPHVIQTMAVIEDEEHLEDFLKNIQRRLIAPRAPCCLTDIFCEEMLRDLNRSVDINCIIFLAVCYVRGIC